MNQGQIKIGATSEGWFPAEDCEFEVTISKGSIEYSLHFYGNVDDWKAYGERLMAFPLNIDDQAQFELGSRRYSTHLTLAAYCYDEQGHTAIGIAMGKNGDEPYRCHLAFSIPAEAASINQLGSLLLNWRVENGSEIIWEAQIS